jgi:hypothetical protein
MTRYANAPARPCNEAEARATFVYFFCSIGSPQHFKEPVPPFVTITCELHF